MKVFLYFLVVVMGIGVLYWFYSGNKVTHPYPKIAPSVFFTILPNHSELPTAEDVEKYDMLDEFGYQKMDLNGMAAITALDWSKRDSTYDPYDVDLLITAAVLATEEDAIKFYVDQLDRVKMKNESKSGSFDMDVSPQHLKADKASAYQTVVSGHPAFYTVYERFGNYCFTFVGQLHPDGYFTKKEEFFEKVKQLDEHIFSTLVNE